MNELLSTALWFVGKALAPVADSVLGHWDASKNLGLNVDALRTELLLVKATLETASRKHIGGQATEELLRRLQDSAQCAEDLLDELDYYRIHDELHSTYDAADKHAKGGVHGLALNARHTTRAVLGLSSAATPAAAEPGQVLEDVRQRVGCCAWPRARQSSRGNSSSSTPNANQADEHEVTAGCMPKLGTIICKSSLQILHLESVEGMGTLEPLSNLTSLTKLYLWRCGEDLRCKDLGHLLTDGGQLREIKVFRSPRFFSGWDPNPRRVLLLQDDDGGEEHQLVSPPAVSSSKLKELWTDVAAAMGLLAEPICSLLSSSLTELRLYGTCLTEMERFTKEQEDALHLLASLQELEFLSFGKLQHLPAGLHKLTSLKRLEVFSCPAGRLLPKDGLPKSLQELDVQYCDNEELKQQCSGLVGTIPKVKLELGD